MHTNNSGKKEQNHLKLGQAKEKAFLKVRFSRSWQLRGLSNQRECCLLNRQKQRQDTKLDALPGPGSYQPIKPSTAPKYSIYQRYREKTEASGPGPQSYTIGEFRETKSIIFCQAKRDSYNRIQIPGPGEYETELKIKKPQVSIVFGSEKRSQSCSENTKMPGPGAYDIASTFYVKKK